MLEVNGNLITEDEQIILEELKKQLYTNGKDVFHKFTKTSNNLQTTCPFHKEGQERKPSFGILTKDRGNRKAGTCNCFACGWTGSIEEMISNCFGYDDLGKFGSKWLAKNFQVIEVNSRPDISFDLRGTSKQQIKYISDSEYDKYRVYHSYMWKRKMTPETVELFDIGYDAEKSCITFPVKDRSGNILFIARRSVNSKFFNYPSDAEKPVYGLYEMNKYFHQNLVTGTVNDVIICESMINCITCYNYGRYAIALNGTGTQHQYKQLNELSVRHFILALDPDQAGERGRDKLRKVLKNKIVTEFILPKGKDINDLSEEEFYHLKEVMK